MKKLIRALALALLMMFAAPAATANAPPDEPCTDGVCDDANACITDGGCFDAELVLEEVLVTPAPDVIDDCDGETPLTDGGHPVDGGDASSVSGSPAGAQHACDDGNACTTTEVMPPAGDSRARLVTEPHQLRPTGAGRCGLVPRC